MRNVIVVRRRPSSVALLALSVLASLVLVTAACGGIYQDPGPNPARLVEPVKGQVTPQQRADAAEPFGGLEWANFPPRYNYYSEPLWDAQAFILAPDGGLHQLPPAPGTALHEREGYAVDTVAEFLVPPGSHRVRVLLTCTVRRSYYEADSLGTQHQYLHLYARDRVLDLNLYAGQAETVTGLTER